MTMGGDGNDADKNNLNTAELLYLPPTNTTLPQTDHTSLHGGQCGLAGCRIGSAALAFIRRRLVQCFRQ